MKPKPLKSFAAFVLCVLFMPLAAEASGILAAWDVSGLPGGGNNYGPSPFAATTIAANLSDIGLTRGLGVSTSYTAAAGGWGGVGFTGLDADTAIALNQFATFTITPNSGYKVSFSGTDPFDYYRSLTGPPNGVLQFSVGASNFTNITTLGYSVASSGASIGAIDLSGIAALQEVITNVTFRIVNYGGGSRGTWYIYKTVLALQGVVTQVVMPSNSPPILAAIPDRTVALGMSLVITNVATDPDSPPQVLTFSLGTGATASASIDGATGVFSWTPTPAQVGTNAFAVVVTDNGLPPLSTTQSFSVVVMPSNSPPILAAIPDRTVALGMSLVITNVAIDPDSPPQVLTFSLGTGATTSASIDGATGVFSWTPTPAQVGTNAFAVVVTDNGLPPLSTTQSFSVVVMFTTDATSVLSLPVVFVTGEFQCSLSGAMGSRYVIQASGNFNTSAWISLATNAAPFTFTDTNSGAQTQRFYRALLLP